MNSPTIESGKRFVFILLLAFAVNCSIGLSQQRPESNPLVLTGATVIDGLGGSPVPEAVIRIAGDKIESIEGKGAAYPSDSTVVDLSGKFIIPGLIESHVHYEDWTGEVFLNYGVTAVVVMPSGGRMPEGFDQAKMASQQSRVRTPRLYGSGGPLLTPSMTRQQVRDSVREWLQQKPEFARFIDFNDLNKQVYQWAAEEVHRAGVLIFGHSENAPESIRAGHDIIEHIWGFVQAQMSPQELDEFQKGRHLHWATFIKDWTRLDRMIREAVDRGAYINPTLLFEIGSLSPLAAQHEQEAYHLYNDPSLMAYYPGNIADSLLQNTGRSGIFPGNMKTWYCCPD